MAFQFVPRIRIRARVTALKLPRRNGGTSSTSNSVHWIWQWWAKGVQFALRAASSREVERYGLSDGRGVPMSGGEHSTAHKLRCA